MWMIDDICELGYDQLDGWKLDVPGTYKKLKFVFGSIEGDSYLAERCKDLEEDSGSSNFYGYILTDLNKDNYLIFAPDIPTAKHTYKYRKLIKRSRYLKPAMFKNGFQLTVPPIFFGRVYKLTRQENDND